MDHAQHIYTTAQLDAALHLQRVHHREKLVRQVEVAARARWALLLLGVASLFFLGAFLVDRNWSSLFCFAFMLMTAVMTHHELKARRREAERALSEDCAA